MPAEYYAAFCFLRIEMWSEGQGGGAAVGGWGVINVELCLSVQKIAMSKAFHTKMMAGVTIVLQPFIEYSKMQGI